MKNLKKGMLLLIFTLTMFSLFAQAQNIKELDPQNFEKKLKESKEPILVDVRTPGEYAQGHLANAVLIDIYSDDFKSRVSKLDKSKPVFVYCKAGSRSSSAVSVFEDLEFKEIYDLSGGISAWQRVNKPIVKK
ncbi:MAG: rhodanese-like domain-containing protein [Cyclobacteriaceae bacterium]